MIVPSGGFEHRFPLDCWRYYPDGAKALAHWADLDVVSVSTAWVPRRPYADDSATWADTVLVARKPRYPHWAQRVPAAAKRRLLGSLQLQGRLRQTLAPDGAGDQGQRRNGSPYQPDRFALLIRIEEHLGRIQSRVLAHRRDPASGGRSRAG